MSIMRWKQFFTPVKSINADQAREFMETQSSEELTTLDVRQPTEYEAGHIPGAKLIPLPDLTNRLSEINHNKPVMVY
jgi:rhodanese-related sulfurtransferase